MPLLNPFIVIYHQDYILSYYILLHHIICIVLHLQKPVLSHVIFVHSVLVSPPES